jgi:hypothetical protein
MKCKLIIGILILFIEATAQAQPTQILQPSQGLLNKLIEIKYSSELYLSNALKKSEIKIEVRDSAQAVYNTLRYKIDGLIYSLSADMIASNSPRKMRLLNDWCLDKSKNKKSIQVYATQLDAIEQLYHSNILKPNYESVKNINLSTNIFYLMKDSYTIIQGLSDMKTKQTMALIELLDHTRLMAPSDMSKLLK